MFLSGAKPLLMSDIIYSKYLVPRFATESEEADWWYENRHIHAEEWLQLMKEGVLMSTRLYYRLEPLDKPPKEPAPE